MGVDLPADVDSFIVGIGGERSNIIQRNTVRIIQRVKSGLCRHDARELPRVDDTGRSYGNAFGTQKIEMTVNRIAFNRIDRTVNINPAFHQIGKGVCAAKFEVGNMTCVKAERGETVIGKIAIDFLRVNIVDIASLLDFRRVARILRRYRRCLGAEGIGENPRRHGQRSENQTRFHLPRLGAGFFVVPVFDAIPVCHRDHLLSFPSLQYLKETSLLYLQKVAERVKSTLVLSTRLS